MTEFLHCVLIIFVGLLTVALVVFVKINDLTAFNPNINYWPMARLFARKAAPSYLASFTALLIYSLIVLAISPLINIRSDFLSSNIPTDFT